MFAEGAEAGAAEQTGKEDATNDNTNTTDDAEPAAADASDAAVTVEGEAATE